MTSRQPLSICPAADPSPSARQHRKAMAGTGTESTTLMVLRGNSASGTSQVASALHSPYGRGIAIVAQDCAGMLTALREDHRAAPTSALMSRSGNHPPLRHQTTVSQQGRAETSACGYPGTAAAVAEREGLAEDWLNDAVKGFLPGPDPDAQRFYSSDSLIVDVASPRYLLDEGLDLVERAYPGRPVPAKVKFLLTEIVDSMQN